MLRFIAIAAATITLVGCTTTASNSKYELADGLSIKGAAFGKVGYEATPDPAARINAICSTL